jgi:hypothetical protein
MSKFSFGIHMALYHLKAPQTRLGLPFQKDHFPLFSRLIREMYEVLMQKGRVGSRSLSRLYPIVAEEIVIDLTEDRRRSAVASFQRLDDAWRIEIHVTSAASVASG